MSCLKRLASAVALSALLGVFAWAQFPMSSADIMKEAANRMDMIAKKLNLSPAQVEKIKPLLTSQLQDMGKAREKYQASDKSDAAKREAEESLKETHGKYETEIKSELSPEQVKEWDKMSKSWKSDLNLKGLK